MREIKYRVFDKKNKKMFYFDMMWLCQEYRSLCLINSDEEVDYYDDLFNIDIKQCEVTQYTGLKDKNGVEIYEGDIYKIEGFDNYYVVMMEKNHCRECGIKQGWSIRSNTEDVEVIGNRFENKELLLEESK